MRVPVASLFIVAISAAWPALALPTYFEYNGPPVAIPDANPVGVSVTIPVTLNTPIADLDIVFALPSPGTPCTSADTETNASISHTYAGDLEVDVRSPAGTTVSVLLDIGGSSENICALTLDDDSGDPAPTVISENNDLPLLGRYLPSSALSAFDGQVPAGNWVITVRDDAGSDTGTLRRIGLKFNAANERRRIAGTFSIGTTTMMQRITRNGEPSVCEDKMFPGLFATAGSYQFKTHSFTNPLSRRACFNFQIQTDDRSCAANLAMMAYSAFNPANLSSGYLGDSGSSIGLPPTTVGQQIAIGAGETISLVVYASESIPGSITNCPYHINVGYPALYDDSLE